jgi:hypothetical protein
MKFLVPTISIALFLLLFSIAPSFAAEGYSEVEPNDSVDIADTVDGFIIQGSFSKGDNDDWFVLNGQEGENPSLAVVFDGEAMELNWEVYSDDDVVESMTGDGSPESVTVDVPGTCYVHVWRVRGKGDYTFAISNPDCMGADEQEPNDEEILADETSEPVINGYLCPSDNDWYSITSLSGNTTFTLSFDDETVEPDWEIYNDSEVVASSEEYGSPDTLTARITGDCYIHVWAYSGEGEYKIKVED